MLFSDCAQEERPKLLEGHCSILDFTHLAQYLLINCLHFFISAICKFVSDKFLIRSNYNSESVVKGQSFIIPITQAHNVLASWPAAVVFAVCSSAAF